MKKKVLEEVLERPRVCARKSEGDCSGRLTIEHAFGRVNEQAWTCIILCWQHHLVDLNKDLNRHLALQQATEDDLKKYSKCWKEYVQMKKHLEDKYGENLSD